MIDNLIQLKRKKQMQIRKLQDQFYLVGDGQCYELNITGAVIVNNIEKDITIDDLCKKISEKFSFPDIAQIRADVYSFIEFLCNEGIISYDSPG